MAVVTDLRLTDTGDLFYDSDLLVIEGTDLVQQNMMKFLRSETSDVPLNPSMAFSFIDYAGLPNTRDTADLIKNDFLDKTSVLDSFSEYNVDVDIWPIGGTKAMPEDLQMEITILGEETAPVVLHAPILLQNGFVTSLPSSYDVKIYDPEETVNVIERITLSEKTNRIPVKYQAQIDEFLIFAVADEPDVDEEGNLSNLITISGALSPTSVDVDLDSEIPALSGNRVFDSVFSVSGVILTEVEDTPGTYEYVENTDDKLDLTFGVVHSVLDYDIRYDDVVALAESLIETDIEIPRPDDLSFPYSVENKLYYVALNTYLDPGTYVIQYRASAIL
jgi:hypothetical protein